MTNTPIYLLGYFVPNMVIGDDLDLDKNRFTTIENQLYNLYNIFGNGILDVTDSVGQQLPSWELSAVPGLKSVQISSGRGHINYKYAETLEPTTIALALPSGVSSGGFWYYFYATENNTTTTEKTVTFLALTNQSFDSSYVGLGAAYLFIDSVDFSFTITVYNSEAYGRQEISLFSTLSGLVKNHVHIGGSNNPSPIDLGKHVTGFLSSENIDNLDLNTVTAGTLNPDRLPTISHSSLTDIGTLTHEQIDALLAAIQGQSDDYKISDYGIVNRLQIILALKRQVGFFNIDGGQFNSIFYLPYLQLNDFVDTKLYQFSTGMISRLAFSTTIFCVTQKAPEILLLDEVFGSGGDEKFKEKSFKTPHLYKSSLMPSPANAKELIKATKKAKEM
jgi:hypothetical protein